MNNIEPGQVLWLRIRFNNSGQISTTKHPYLVLDIDDDYGTIEVAQMDSAKGKEYKVAFKSNHLIKFTEPSETVISEDSFIQKDNKFMIENYEDLEKYKHTNDKLSEDKFKNAYDEYYKYQDNENIDENKIVYLSKEELESLNN